ncbi:hypothetical protein AF226_14940 [Listeria monocytogenes]|nr:hypothetical protein [Listeria phage PSU-VKH-LP041]EAC2216487.1 hypothetical protein [Listeria monocytogenes]KHK10940.1 hypothetical protein I794_04880 [Listeria monocytogenes SHL002]EAC2936022.1 hypothetical protein [Listeria monocytogenes]EAC3184257.1 hypothetical protein [Listeria monocytogenes]
MCEYCKNDNTTKELECIGDPAHVTLEKCITSLGNSMYSFVVVEAEGCPQFATEIYIKYCPMCGRSLG